jgi:ribosomal protein S18 acetylase RimI-like enzyme
MACTEGAVVTHALRPAHVSAALALSAGAGWNQTAEDWALFIARGRVDGVFVDGNLIATAATLAYGAFGYIAMVLVSPPFRRRGIATRLLATAIRRLEQERRVSMLDATQDGAAVYRRLGFREVFGMRRFEGRGRSASVPLAAASSADGPVMVDLDARAFGASRGFLISDFLAREGTRAFVAPNGFVIRRRGLRADQIGPLVAPDESTAAALLTAALDARPGPVFLDLLERRPGLSGILAERDLTVQRPFIRMALGTSQPFGDPALLFVAAGPEFG